MLENANFVTANNKGTVRCIPHCQSAIPFVGLGILVHNIVVVIIIYVASSVAN
jgi:hypothetical protein